MGRQLQKLILCWTKFTAMNVCLVLRFLSGLKNLTRGWEETEDNLHLGRPSTTSITYEKVCSEVVLKPFTLEQKDSTMNISADILKTIRKMVKLLENIINCGFSVTIQKPSVNWCTGKFLTHRDWRKLKNQNANSKPWWFCFLHLWNYAHKLGARKSNNELTLLSRAPGYSQWSRRKQSKRSQRKQRKTLVKEVMDSTPWPTVN